MKNPRMKVTPPRPVPGQIIVNNAEDYYEAIQTARDVFPTASIALVTFKRRLVKRWCRNLRQEGLRNVFDDDHLIGSPRDRIVVCTAYTFDFFNDSDWDIVIFDSPAIPISKRGFKKIQDLNYQRAFFMPGRPIRWFCLRKVTRLHRREEKRLKITCGDILIPPEKPIIHVIPWTGRPQAPKRRRRPSGLAIAALERKRRLWRNTRRNALLANVARALAREDVKRLRRYGLNLPEKSISFITDTGSPRVAIIVESPEHGRILQKHLPDWPLLSCVRDEDGDLEWPSAQDKGMIVTELVAFKKQPPGYYLDASVVVKASGSLQPEEMGKVFSRGHQGNHQLIILIEPTK